MVSPTSGSPGPQVSDSCPAGCRVELCLTELMGHSLHLLLRPSLPWSWEDIKLFLNQTLVSLPMHSKAIYWHQAVVKEGVYCRAPSNESRQLVLKRPKLPDGFQGKVFKDRVREGGRGLCDPLVDILLIGWWWSNRESASSTFWFQLVWDLRAGGQHTVNFFHLVGVSASAKQLKGHDSEYHL